MANLFNNPMIRSALKTMTPEQIEIYQDMGKSLWKDIDFTKSQDIINFDPVFHESTAYIIEGIKSGLLPEDMSDAETNIMEEAYGKEWYKKFSYEESDLKVTPSIVIDGNKVTNINNSKPKTKYINNKKKKKIYSK
jgi:hypothetical protein